MTEKNLQRHVLKLLREQGSVHKHNDVSPGVPDLSFSVNGVCGWIELKYLEKPPVREKTILRFCKGQDMSWKHQRLWLANRGRAGANCFVVARVADEVLVFWWETAIQYLDKCTWSELQEHADCVLMRKGLTSDDLMTALVAIILRKI